MASKRPQIEAKVFRLTPQVLGDSQAIASRCGNLPGCQDFQSDTEDLLVKRTAVLLPLAFLAATWSLFAQSSGAPNRLVAAQSPANAGASQTAPVAKAASNTKNADDAKATKKAEVRLEPFSELALGGGMSLMGINLQAATNVNRYLNLRGYGNVFNYSLNDISTNGFNLNGKVNMATAGAALDYYPFPKLGFRVSPGFLFLNQNGISATASPTLGSSITLNHQDFYSEAANPLTVNASLGLNTHKQAFTLTTGWGNVIPRKRQDLLFSHLTFPFEFGAAFTGAPTLNMALSGFACTNKVDAATNGPSCVNMATNAQAQSDLNAQLQTWKSDLDPLKVYPILSLGVSYAFRVR